MLLPPDPDNRVLTRELVYTAISRTRVYAEIWTTHDSLRAALARPIQRGKAACANGCSRLHNDAPTRINLHTRHTQGQLDLTSK